jgi:hypothetical protein
MGNVSAGDICLTSEYFRQEIGLLKYPCRNMRKRRNGRATASAKKTCPILGGMLAKAYRTQRMTKSSKSVAFCTKGGWFSRRVRYLSRTNEMGSLTTSHFPLPIQGFPPVSEVHLYSRDTTWVLKATYAETATPAARRAVYQIARRTRSAAAPAAHRIRRSPNTTRDRAASFVPSWDPQQWSSLSSIGSEADGASWMVDLGPSSEVAAVGFSSGFPSFRFDVPAAPAAFPPDICRNKTLTGSTENKSLKPCRSVVRWNQTNGANSARSIVGYRKRWRYGPVQRSHRSNSLLQRLMVRLLRIKVLSYCTYSTYLPWVDMRFKDHSKKRATNQRTSSNDNREKVNGSK